MEKIIKQFLSEVNQRNQNEPEFMQAVTEVAETVIPYIVTKDIYYGPDDFASMEQVIFRRLSRLLKESKPLPNLIIVDGGKGQLSAGLKSIKKLNLEKKVAIIGIAKRLEEIFKPNDKLPLYIDKKSETLKLIQQLRNEAHRFAINFHRDIRSKDALKSGIDDLVGIGPIFKDKLLKKYKSFIRLKEVEEDELIEFLGKNRGRSVFNQLRN